ncbi:glycosyltransferase family 2 protein, partial [Opitutales bacterium]|nr:glycosyltransferase family 2 protein [Opitutales bacterium]
QPNGVGRALREGYSQVKGEYCLSMDCDFQHLITEFVGLFDALNQGADVVVGSRFSQNSILLNYPFMKILFNRMFHFLLAIFTRNQFRDLTNNLKIMKKEVLDNIPINENGFAANAETGIYPILLGYNVCEIPMSWVNRDSQMGISSFKLIQVGKGYLRVFLKALKYKYFNTKL